MSLLTVTRIVAFLHELKPLAEHLVLLHRSRR